jgi:hypothetical protein
MYPKLHMTQHPPLSSSRELTDAAFNTLWEKFRDRFPVDSNPEVARAFAEAVAGVLTPPDVPALNREPVFFRYRHSEQEKWHYGPVALNWWECQPLFALSESPEGGKPDYDDEGKDVQFADWLGKTTPQDWAAFNRFYACLEDGEGYDVPAAKMDRLAELGLVRKVRGTVFEFTQLGLSMQPYAYSR